MAKFREGQRVRVPVNNQTAPSMLYGKEGVITTVAPPGYLIVEGQRDEPVEQAYMVSFDGETEERYMVEKQLEAV